MKRSWLVGSALAVTLFAYAGCANDGADVVAQLDGGADAATGPSFVAPPEAGTDADAASVPEEPEKVLACVGTECPYPFATCETFGTLGYKCQNNLLTDNANCGECGNVCPPDMFSSLRMATRCVAGKCQRECAPDGEREFRDCNGWVDDGCEIDITSDADNCGGCGNKCGNGQPCIGGKCGCPAGQAYCGDELGCRDVSSDNFSCGTCGTRCVAPDAGPPPTNMEYGCVSGECGKPRCKSGFKQAWANCNGDLEDGCEINTATDPNNCGVCGKKCGPGQICLQEGMNPPRCACAANETLCGVGNALSCADLMNDPNNCGVCGNRCTGGTNHGAPTCRKGFCDYDCEQGWGDCDGNPANGCETNLMVNQGNCGACGNRCDTGAGQPCIAGKCLMVECDDDPVTK